MNYVLRSQGFCSDSLIKVTLRGTCGVKLIDRKNTGELMTMFGLTVSMEMAGKTLRWFGQVLRAEKDNPARMALNFEVRKVEGCPKST